MIDIIEFEEVKMVMIVYENNLSIMVDIIEFGKVKMVMIVYENNLVCVYKVLIKIKIPTFLEVN